MTSMSLQTSSRVWSCSTLRDGADHLLDEAQKIEDEEDKLEKMIQEMQAKQAAPQLAPTGGASPEAPAKDLVAEAATQEATDSQLLEAGCPLAKRTDAANRPPNQSAKGVAQSTTPEGPQVEEALGTKVEGRPIPTPSRTPVPEPATQTAPVEPDTSSKGNGMDQPVQPKPTKPRKSRQELLRDAAKAQIRRMCTKKNKRLSLNVPEWVVAEWKSRPQAETAQLLMNCNFDKDKFVSQLEIVVKKRSSMTVVIDEQWASEKEMKDDLGWSTTRIAGAKKACEAKRDTHVRKNQYDGVEEFYVTVREKGERKQEESQEEIRRKLSAVEAGQEPKLDADAFDNLQSMKDRQAATAACKTNNGQTAPVSQEEETKRQLRKFLDSIVQKSGKMRSLIRELNESYTKSSLMMAQVKCLEDHLKKLDKHFDACNVVMAKGEMTQFKKPFVADATAAMTNATYACADACALETKTRNAKKYEKKDSALPDNGQKPPKSSKRKREESEPSASAKKPKGKKDKKEKKTKKR